MVVAAERYDRNHTAADPRRIHPEDICDFFGIVPTGQYVRTLTGQASANIGGLAARVKDEGIAQPRLAHLVEALGVCRCLPQNHGSLVCRRPSHDGLKIHEQS